MNEVKQMKHIFEDLDSKSKKNENKNDMSINSSSLSKEGTKNNNISTSKSSNSSNHSIIEDKEKILEKENIFIVNEQKEKDKNEKNLLYFNKVNEEYILNDKLFKDNYYDIWPNEINNILSSTVDVSIKEDNDLNLEKNKFNFEKQKINFRKSYNGFDLYSKPVKTNNLYLRSYDNINSDNKNRFENDECSNMTNLYLNEYENKKDIYEFV